MVDRSEIAVGRFRAGFNCAQAVLSAYAAELGIPEETALRLGAPFGGGFVRRGEMCGAVTGALLALGLRHGPTRAEDTEGKERQYEICRDLIARFQQRHGSVLCRDLLGSDISTADGWQEVHERDLCAQVCPRFVEDAAKLVAPRLESTQ